MHTYIHTYILTIYIYIPTYVYKCNIQKFKNRQFFGLPLTKWSTCGPNYNLVTRSRFPTNIIFYNCKFNMCDTTASMFVKF